MRRPILWVIILIIIIGLYATNPTKTEFKEYAVENIKKEIQKAGVTSNSFINSVLGVISGYVAEKAVDIAVTRDNYFLFSVFSVEGLDIEYKFLGIFRSFIPIKNYIDAKKININFKDPRAIIDETLEIKEDHYKYFSIELDGPTEISIIAETISGPQLDIYFVDKMDFEIWQELDIFSNEQIEYYIELSCIESKEMNKKARLNEGEYYLIMDNTDLGNNIPPMNFNDDTANLKIKVLLKELY